MWGISKRFIKDTAGCPIVISGVRPYWGLFPIWAMFHFQSVKDARIAKWMLWWGVN